jgi:branched-chain amino acid aminotransferase
MSVRMNERVAWFNGAFMPEREVRIPFRDLSWVYGDGCFDMTRSFGHRLFKVQEHVERLYRSLKYLRIDPGFGPRRMGELTEELFQRNRHLLGPDDDYWVGQRISRGVKDVEGDGLDRHGPTWCSNARPCPSYSGPRPTTTSTSSSPTRKCRASTRRPGPCEAPKKTLSIQLQVLE